jgi:flavin-binding protein dodecin
MPVTETSVAKIIELSAASPESFGDAIRRGISRATTSIDDVRGAWIKEQKVVVEKGQIVEYRVDMKVTFVVHQ